MQVILHPEATVELAEAAAYYEGQQPLLGARFLRAVADGAQRLREFPEAWPRVSPNVRKCAVRDFPYRLMFCCEAAHLEIVAVAHSSRRPGYWRDRRW